MFGRRRRSQVPVIPPTPSPSSSLSPDEVYDLVNRKVLDALGPEGRYSLVLRSAADTDAIFSQLAARSLSLAITRSIVGPDVLPSHAPTHGKAAAAESARREHAAIAVWADPRRHDPDAVDPAIVSPSTGLHLRGADRTTAAS
ncbi:hypothetical protein ELQ92_08585 [Labedella populi]|uniref:Uncharacterized protein n=1 Tax=Labedella populi TaxID=2498850 RepID=A0A3S4DWX0_9MICO|nr:hypothetical protein [Labedella populi]RWZ61093.1 hypothetical protein ELQ92_08585 [Labedella populi]